MVTRFIASKTRSRLAAGSVRWMLAALLPLVAGAKEPTPDQLEFFEKRVRPILAAA